MEFVNLRVQLSFGWGDVNIGPTRRSSRMAPILFRRSLGTSQVHCQCAELCCIRVRRARCWIKLSWAVVVKNNYKIRVQISSDIWNVCVCVCVSACLCLYVSKI